MAVYGETRSDLLLMCTAHLSVFETAGHEIKTYRMNRSETGKTIKRLKDPGDFFRHTGKQEAMAGILFDISGDNACPSYMNESGIHRFHSNQRKTDCRVHCVTDSPEEYRIPDPVFKDRKERRPRRTWRLDENCFVDHELGKRIAIGAKPFADNLKKAMALCLKKRIDTLFE